MNSNLDLAEFWKQLFYPMSNFIELAWVIFITLLSEKIVEELDEADIVKINWFNNNFVNGLLTFVIRFISAFCIISIIAFLFIAFVSIAPILIKSIFSHFW